MSKGTIIKTEKFTLRPWSMDDYDELAAIANDKEISDNLRDGFPHPFTKDEAIAWLKKVVKMNQPTKFFAIEVENKVAGSIGIIYKDDIYRLNAEIGYYMGKAYWNKGVMTGVIKEIAKYIFETTEVIRIYAEPFENNTGSRIALKRAGFIHEATFKNNVIKNGKILSSCIYSLLKS